MMIGIVIFFFYYVMNHLSDFKRLLFISVSNFWFIFIIGFIFIFVLFLNGFLLNTLMKPFGIFLQKKEWMALSVVTFFYNYITPLRGGSVIRSIYLKRKYNFSYSHFISTLSAIYIIIFLVGSFIGILSMLLVWIRYDMFSPLIFFILLLIFLFLLLITIFSPRCSESKNKWINFLVKIGNGWHLIKNDKKILFIITGITLVQLISNALIFILIFKIISVKIDMSKSLFISSINSISLLFSITPGSLGISDVTGVFSARLIGINLPEAIAGVVLKRSVELLFIFILGPIFSYILMKNLKSLDK